MEWVLRVALAIPGFFSLGWIIWRHFVQEKQDLRITPVGITRKRNLVGPILERFNAVHDGLPIPSMPDEVHVEVINSGNRAITVREVVLTNPVTGERVGGKFLRFLGSGQTRKHGRRLEVEEIEIFAAPLITKANGAEYRPADGEECEITMVSSGGRSFKSVRFRFDDLGEPDNGLGWQLVGEPKEAKAETTLPEDQCRPSGQEQSIPTTELPKGSAFPDP